MKPAAPSRHKNQPSIAKPRRRGPSGRFTVSPWPIDRGQLLALPSAIFDRYRNHTVIALCKTRKCARRFCTCSAHFQGEHLL